MDHTTERCRTCGAPIIWAVSEATGKLHPLDAEPPENGNLQITGLSHPEPGRRALPLVRVLGPIETELAGEPLYLSHFATCPQADKHRSKR